MKLAAYARVSTDRQAEDGVGLDVQERAIRKWARDNGHRIVMVARDEGVSGSTTLDARAGLHDTLVAVGQALLTAWWCTGYPMKTALRQMIGGNPR